MNLFELQENLKNFSQDQLVSEMRNPSGSAPQYLILSELQRRRRIMNEEQAQMPRQEASVAEEAVAAAGMPQGGLAQMAQAMAPQTDMTQNTARMAEGGVVRMQPGGLAGISANLTDFMPIGPASGRNAARGAGRYANITPGQIGGTIAVDALLADPRIREAAARSELSTEDYISRLSPDQFSSAIEMLSQPIDQPVVRDESSFALEGQPVPDLSPAALPQSGLTGVEPVPVVSREDIMAEANRPENLIDLTDQEIAEVAGAPFVAEVEALADPELEGVTEEAARRLGELYVEGAEAAAETPLPIGEGIDSIVDFLAGEPPRPAGTPGSELGFSDELTATEEDLLPIRTELSFGDVEPQREDTLAPAVAGGGSAAPAGPSSDDLFEQDKWLALAQFGLGLMSSQAPTIGQAIGEAGTTGIAALMQAREDRRDREIAAQTRADRLAAAAARASTDEAEYPYRQVDDFIELAKLFQARADSIKEANFGEAPQPGEPLYEDYIDALSQASAAINRSARMADS